MVDRPTAVLSGVAKVALTDAGGCTVAADAGEVAVGVKLDTAAAAGSVVTAATVAAVTVSTASRLHRRTATPYPRTHTGLVTD